MIKKKKRQASNPKRSRSQTQTKHNIWYFLVIFSAFYYKIQTWFVIFDRNCSTVSTCSNRHCGIKCGQKILPINGNPAAYGEYFCCVYITLQNRKSQVIFSFSSVRAYCSKYTNIRYRETEILSRRCLRDRTLQTELCQK